MEAALIIGAMILFIVLRGVFKKDDDSEDYSTATMGGTLSSGSQTYDPQEINIEKSKERMDNITQTSQEIMVAALTGIGCQPTVNEDGSVSVTYQGEHFQIDFSSQYAQIWDLGWAVLKADNPELPAIREAVNLANYNFGPTVVLSHPDEEGTLYLHSRMGVLLHPGVTEIDDYIRDSLKMFFAAKDAVRQHFQQLRFEQQHPREPRRPIGFSSAPESTEINPN